jgi:hypothetical protein
MVDTEDAAAAKRREERTNRIFAAICAGTIVLGTLAIVLYLIVFK